MLSNVLSASLSSEGAVDMASIESSNFASLLGTQCYLLFSSGCRYTFLGFKVAHEALKQASSTMYGRDLSEKAGLYLCKAARQWSNAELISGLFLHGANDDGQIGVRSLVADKKFISIAQRAFERGSPLARAAKILMELEQVSALVNMCLICAKNFGAKRDDNMSSNGYLQDDDEPTDIFAWEKDLYSQYPTLKDSIIDSNKSEKALSSAVATATPSGGAAIIGIEVTKSDGLLTCYSVLFYCMMNVLTNKGVLTDEMISTAASSSDVDFLHLLYEFLFSTDHIDKLLRIESMDLAEWLKSEKQDLSLLWRHYTFHGFNAMAGQVMLERARCPIEKNVTLEERIESLTRAVNSFSTALEHDRVLANVDYSPLSQGDLRSLIAQANEIIEVALLQKRTIAYLESKGVQYEDILRIKHTILSLTDLYNDFAVPYYLYDLCLLIIHACGYEDQEIISTLWKSIICEEILPCKTNNRDVSEFLEILKSGSMLVEEEVTLIEQDMERQVASSLKWFEQGEWIPSLKGRIASLGKELNSNVTFPLAWIVDTLNGTLLITSVSDYFMHFKVINLGSIFYNKGLQRVFQASTRGSSSSTEILWSVQILAEIGVNYPVGR